MKLVPKKNHYMNIPGQKKVKVLTKGKAYDAAIWEAHGSIQACYIENDLGIYQTFHSMSIFMNIEKSRNRKLSSIGI